MQMIQGEFMHARNLLSLPLFILLPGTDEFKDGTGARIRPDRHLDVDRAAVAVRHGDGGVFAPDLIDERVGTLHAEAVGAAGNGERGSRDRLIVCHDEFSFVLNRFQLFLPSAARRSRSSVTSFHAVS